MRQELDVESLTFQLREGRLKSFGHVWRRDKHYIGKKVMRMSIGKEEGED